MFYHLVQEKIGRQQPIKHNAHGMACHVQQIKRAWLIEINVMDTPYSQSLEPRLEGPRHHAAQDQGRANRPLRNNNSCKDSCTRHPP